MAMLSEDKRMLTAETSSMPTQRAQTTPFGQAQMQLIWMAPPPANLVTELTLLATLADTCDAWDA